LEGVRNGCNVLSATFVAGDSPGRPGGVPAEAGFTPESGRGYRQRVAEVGAGSSSRVPRKRWGRRKPDSLRTVVHEDRLRRRLRLHRQLGRGRQAATAWGDLGGERRDQGPPGRRTPDRSFIHRANTVRVMPARKSPHIPCPPRGLFILFVTHCFVWYYLGNL